ncbi:hypothetical protein HMPREF9303_0738 [Prevotella denticola CRIS 18C-A]|uniref:Uncharacterized protein n=1 Tax=Prevotella denticola CRIS 18C-A TaxID=944557 RepID=F0H870_9BACT|nr:hypothetical protein HMPREF9303_0738 [Prevotella denticola CRIS 18C-A]
MLSGSLLFPIFALFIALWGLPLPLPPPLMQQTGAVPGQG